MQPIQSPFPFSSTPSKDELELWTRGYLLADDIYSKSDRQDVSEAISTFTSQGIAFLRGCFEGTGYIGVTKGFSSGTRYDRPYVVLRGSKMWVSTFVRILRTLDPVLDHDDFMLMRAQKIIRHGTLNFASTRAVRMVEILWPHSTVVTLEHNRIAADGIKQWAPRLPTRGKLPFKFQSSPLIDVRLLSRSPNVPLRNKQI